MNFRRKNSCYFKFFIVAVILLLSEPLPGQVSQQTVSIHQWHLRFLVTKVYKSTYYLNPKFMCSFFTDKEIPHNLRKGQLLSLPPARSTYYGTNSVHFRGSLILNNLPGYIKSSRSVCEFKNNIKNFRDIFCGCLICRTWM